MSIIHNPCSYLAVIIVLTGSLFLIAEDKSVAPSSQFTSRTDLVMIPTLVTDKSGTHIKGLHKEDFTVLEDGSERKIALFEEVNSSGYRPLRSKSPTEFSNSWADISGGRITLVVLDFINTPFSDQAAARKGLLKYLAESMDYREPTALYTLSRSGIHVIHDFTNDPRILVAALHKLTGYPVDMDESVDASLVQSEAGKLQAMIKNSELDVEAFQQRLAITYTLEGMQQLAHAFIGVPGRKSLIWVSGGFPFDVSDNTMKLAPLGRDSLKDVLPLYEQTWQLLGDSQIALYPVDVTGPQITMPSAAVHNPNKQDARNMDWRQMDTLSTIKTFASMTGGRAYYNSNDLAKGFRDAVNDSAQYYLLGYYLDRSKTKDGWRKLNVRVKRSHVEVRARNGFFITNTSLDYEAKRKNDIIAAFQSPLDYTAIPITLDWGSVVPTNASGKKRVNFKLHLTAETGLVNEADNNHVVLEFLVLAKTPDGKQIENPLDRTIDAHLSGERLSSIRRNGMDYTGALDLPPGQFTVWFVVRDNLAGTIGSVLAPLELK